MKGCSSRYGAFMKVSQRSGTRSCLPHEIRLHLYPRILAQLNPHFSYRDCIFEEPHSDKRSGVVCGEMGVKNYFTLYASNHGTRKLEFSQRSYLEMGQDAAEALGVYSRLIREASKESTNEYQIISQLRGT